MSSLFGDWPVFAEGDNWERAQDRLAEAGLGDGLPLCLPTQAGLERMLAGLAAPDVSLGQMPPIFGELTPAAIGYMCRLAGARPAEMAVVTAAALACLEPQFNLLGLLTTTGTAAVAMLVHGPVTQSLGMSASTNCLGPGNRANACIGRALSLVLRNIGGAREGVGDMATMGQPGKYTFCCAESADTTYPPLHVRRGLAAGMSAVTVLGVSGTAEILPRAGAETPEAILDPIALAMTAAVATGSSAPRPEGPEQVVLLPPELARRIAGAGWDLSRAQKHLFERGRVLATPEATPMARSAADIHLVVTGGPGQKISYLPLWGGGSSPVTRALGWRP